MKNIKEFVNGMADMLLFIPNGNVPRLTEIGLGIIGWGNIVIIFKGILSLIY